MQLFSIIDIMGYKASVHAGKIELVTESIRDVIKSLSLFFSTDSEAKWELYSDSIFIAKQINSDDDVVNFFKCMQMIAVCAFAGKHNDKLPYKGAVSSGEVLVRDEVLCANVGDIKTGIEKRVSYFIGSPVAIAYELQEAIDFFGICIDTKTVASLREQYKQAWQTLVQDRIVDEVMVPTKTKDGNINNRMYVVNIVDVSFMSAVGIWFNLEPRYFHKNEKVRKKFENTWIVAAQLIANARIHQLATKKDK